MVDNPYLDDFYHQMERWSFNLQIYFLNSRFRQVIHIRKESHSRPYEDAHIFAPNLYSMGLMTNRDFQNYSFELMESTVKAPDLLIYLRSSIPNLVDKYIKEDANMKTHFY
jgi:deoxyadenosine/deoxycytidine kinase